MSVPKAVPISTGSNPTTPSRRDGAGGFPIADPRHWLHVTDTKRGKRLGPASRQRPDS
jgi:hypothetical protein